MNKIRQLALEGISKSFGEVAANRAIDLTVRSGEIVGLLGENGAGKTTLMNILYGLYQPDSGTISINGEPVSIRSPKDSIGLGIGMVHQHFMLVQNHTVAENVSMAYAGRRAFFPAQQAARLLEAFRVKYRLEIKPDRLIWQLSAGEQQRVEIAKLLVNRADLLIMDEPTSVLSPKEAEKLMETLRRLRNEGHLVIFISHKLEEVLAICDRVVVLRKGAIAGTARTGEVDRSELANMMVGREVLFHFDRPPFEAGDDILAVKSLSVNGDRGLYAVKDVSFTVREHEIFGIAGVSGNGQRELVEAVTGLRRGKSGSIEIDGELVSNRSARIANDVGVTHVPEERIRFGVAGNLLLYDNAVLKHHHRKPFSNAVFMDYPTVKNHARDIVIRFRVDTPSIHARTRDLSGGNIQKLILGREISGKHRLLVASHPTYGLDVGATEFIRAHLLDRRREGCAVLLVSEDLEEILELSDRIAVMFEGCIMEISDAGTVDIARIGMLMAGSAASASSDESEGSNH